MNMLSSQRVQRRNNVRVLLPVIGMLLAAQMLTAQTTGVVISDDTSAVAHPSAILDVSVTSPSKKGILIPRVTESERLAIDAPADGLLVYQADGTTGFYYYNGAEWTGVASTQPEDWQSATLSGSWVDYGGGYSLTAYFKDVNGIVHMRGLVKDGSGTILTLPEGYRPSLREIHIVLTNTGIGRVDIQADGVVTLIDGSNTWVSLDGITFRVD